MINKKKIFWKESIRTKNDFSYIGYEISYEYDTNCENKINMVSHIYVVINQNFKQDKRIKT